MNRSQSMSQVLPPEASRRVTTTENHGHWREDAYAWMKDENWQEVMQRPEILDKDIRAYLEAENAYTDQMMAPTESLQEKLFEELKGRIKEDDSSVPSPDGEFEYYRRYEVGAQHPIYCRRLNSGGDEQILLDGNVEAEGHDFFRISQVAHSPDHGLLAYGVDVNGSEFYAIHIKDLTTGEMRPDCLEHVQGDMEWANNGGVLFYTVLDENHRPCKVLRHRLGDDPAKDALVYEEADAGFFVGLDKTESRRFIVIDAHDHTTSEVRVIDADALEADPVLIAPRTRDVEYSISHHGDDFFIHTNAGNAEDFKICRCPVETPGTDQWQDLVPHRAGRFIRSMIVFNDWLVWLERLDGLPRIVARRHSDGDEHAISFDEEAYDLSLQAGYEFETPTLRFAYSSLTTPESIFDYHMGERSRQLRKQQEVPSGHDSARYASRRLFAESHDGESIPISLFYAKSTRLDGTAPLLLYGYGAYGMAMPAGFSTNRFSIVDRGFIYAIAHVRGGTEKGYRWYLDGKLDKKTNTFLDFQAAARHLIDEGLTTEGDIVAHGGSAGGMLMGWIANECPNLFKAIIADVPFVDVLNTMLDDSLPLTPPEWPEWGNPSLDKKAFDTILSYSPYDNVRAQKYPNLLVLAGLTDPRVTYWEPAKWVAKLRATKTDDNNLLLKTNMQAGHAGASGRFDRLKEIALTYAFILKTFDRA